MTEFSDKYGEPNWSDDYAAEYDEDYLLRSAEPKEVNNFIIEQIIEEFHRWIENNAIK